MSDLFANHGTSCSNYISIFPLFCLKPVKKWKVKYDWTAYFANNESFCTKPNNVGLAESIHSFDLRLYNVTTKSNDIKIIIQVGVNIYYRYLDMRLELLTENSAALLRC